MPTLSQITNNFFIGLIDRLGVRPPPSESFLLSNVVQPVSIVDADIPLTAIASTQILNTPFTAGLLLSPAGGVIFADTGPQLAGNYSLHIELSNNIAGAASRTNVFMQRRNAANAADIWSQQFCVSVGTTPTITRDYVITLAAGERVRIENGSTTAGDTVQGSIWLKTL